MTDWSSYSHVDVATALYPYLVEPIQQVIYSRCHWPWQSAVRQYDTCYCCYTRAIVPGGPYPWTPLTLIRAAMLGGLYLWTPSALIQPNRLDVPRQPSQQR
jgi:hypothetical protein